MKLFIKENAMRIYMLAIALGVVLRFVVMAVGHNYDFQSYLIVGDLLHKGLDVYANTERYNYGPLFMQFQGIFYEISTNALNVATMYRVLFVSLLTMTDMGIMVWIEKHFGKKPAIIFFLNPVSIIITGFHNQFDNMAVLLMLIAISFYNEEKKVGWRDVCFIICMALSLTMKHIFFIFPLWLLFSGKLPVIKKILYAFIPPVLFLLSFVPSILKNPDNFDGILQNVFLYRSTNNMPLLRWFLKIIGVPGSLYTVIFIVLVSIAGYIFREKDIRYRTLMYLMCLVAFASAVSNQYLAIPMAALCIFSKKLKYVYMLLMGHYLVWNASGLEISSVYPEAIRLPRSEYWGYMLACLMLAVVIGKEIWEEKRKNARIAS